MIEIFVADESVDPEALTLEAAVKLSQQGQTTVWINLRNPETEEIEALGRELSIHELNLEDIRHASSFPKCDNHDHYRFVTLLSPRTAVPREGKFAQRELDIVVGSSLLVTAQTEGLQATQRLRDRLSSDRSLLKRPVDFASHALIDVLVDRYLTAASSIQTRCEELYARVWKSGGELSLFDEILDLRYSCQALSLVVLRSRSVIHKFRWGSGAEVFEASSEVYFSDILDHLDRVEDILKAVANRLRDASDLFRAKEAGRRDNSLKHLVGVGYSLLVLLLATAGLTQIHRLSPLPNNVSGGLLLLILLAFLAVIWALFQRYVRKRAN